MKIYECRRSVSFIDFCPRSLSFQQFQKSSQKPLGRLIPNLMWSLHEMIEQTFVQMVQVICQDGRYPHPYKVKTFKNLLIRNQKVDDLETWHATLGTRVLRNLFERLD